MNFQFFEYSFLLLIFLRIMKFRIKSSLATEIYD